MNLLCRNYEVFEHQRPPLQQRRPLQLPDIVDVQDILFGPPMITLFHQRIMISKGQFVATPQDPLPLGWAQDTVLEVPDTLTVVQASTMALARSQMGIKLKFMHFDDIVSLAIGRPVNQQQENRASAALRKGGYFCETAAALHYFKLSGRLQTNCLGVQTLTGRNFRPDSFILHISTNTRVSKNRKELSYNSLINVPRRQSRRQQRLQIPIIPYFPIRRILTHAYKMRYPEAHDPEIISIVSALNLQNR